MWVFCGTQFASLALYVILSPKGLGDLATSLWIVFELLLLLVTAGKITRSENSLALPALEGSQVVVVEESPHQSVDARFPAAN